MKAFIIRTRLPAVLIAIAAFAAAPSWAEPRTDRDPEILVAAQGVELRIAVDDGLPAADGKDAWRSWLEIALSAARTVSADFPHRRVDVSLMATQRASGAVAFGQVRRTRPPRLRFWIRPDARAEDLLSDWRAYHEFAHLLIPFPGNRDIWFTEGLASYYQYLLQARAGVISQRQAWRELLDGFQRGRDDPAGRGRSLRDLSPDMWRERAFKRVYWTGAAFFLRVDVRLRTETAGRHSLDSALAALHRCCMGERERWTARALVDRLGSLSVPEIWRQEYYRTIDRPARPQTGDALERLGIYERDGRLRLTPGDRSRVLREALAGPRAADQPTPAP